MSPRLSRLVAIARRDLALELQGRRGWVLPAVMAGLLVPASSVKLQSAQPEAMVQQITIPVGGDVPDVIREHPSFRITEGRHAQVWFDRDEDGTVVVRARTIPEDVRTVLDAGQPTIRAGTIPQIVQLPSRALLLALIASSVLTGAVAESIPGERSRRTLDALLAAAITRQELILGKWGAWAGFGMVSTAIAASVALLSGRLEPGWWLLPLPLVPAATVALALFLVRRSTDVIGGATVAQRVVPALLGTAGFVAWGLAGVDGRLGAAIPLGGALIAAGGRWDDLPTIAIAVTSTLLATGTMLALTIRELESDPTRPTRGGPALELGTIGVVAAAAWWVPIAGPVLWALAGNPRLTEELPRDTGVAAAALLLLLACLVQGARSTNLPNALGLVFPRPQAWLAAVLVGGALALADGPIAPFAGGVYLAEVQARLQAALHPGWAGAAALVAVVAGQELLFRGWFRQVGGPIVAVVASVAVLAPLDPLAGLLAAGVLTALAHAAGSTWPALVAHAVWALLATSSPGLPVPARIAILVLATVPLVLWARRAPR